MASKGKFSVREVIKAAWHNLKGSKWVIWAPQLVAILIYLGIGVLFGIAGVLMRLFPHPGTSIPIGFFIGLIIFEILVIFLATPLAAGAQMVALKRNRGETITASDGFKYWHKWLPLGFTVIFFAIGNVIINQVLNFFIGMTAAAHQPFLTIILALIMIAALLLYIAFFMFNVLFVADQNKGPWSALGCSAKIVAPHWFRVILLIFWFGIIAIIVSLPTILGLMCPVEWVKVLGIVVSVILFIWIVPYWNLMLAMAYHKLSEIQKT